MANDVVMNEIENVIEAVIAHSKTAVFAEEVIVPCISSSCNISCRRVQELSSCITDQLH
jgi:hypothetical protein